MPPRLEAVEGAERSGSKYGRLVRRQTSEWRPAHLDRDGLELGDYVAEDRELEAEEDEDADPVGDGGMA